ncbi:hypothetical protein SAMN05421740_11038 [Parapedobacter koreensis]|uniref:Uncharacterized protein n=1 Tax=Parapedobacter koreensis TaxID=332977 RepID=A0A1H7T1X4_9SPHI|nr:hypothetical protein SAMN05421740_11038 [Parapedobacter koreensis]
MWKPSLKFDSCAASIKDDSKIHQLLALIENNR